MPGRRRYSLVAAKPGGPELAVYRDCQCVARPRSLTHLVDFLLAQLNRGAVDDYTGFAVHAGVVGRGVRAVAFPAASGGGKSTITAACLGAGFDYVSDEALCVDFASGGVVSYPKPLALSPHSLSLLGSPDVALPAEGEHDQVAVLAGDLGGRLSDQSLRLSEIVRLVRRPGAPELVQAPRQDALGLLLEMSFNHYKWPRESFELVTRLAREARSWVLYYDDPAAAAALLSERLDADVSPARA